MNDMEAKPSSKNAPSNIASISSAITRGNVTFLKTVLDNCPKHFKPDSHDDLYGDTHLFVLAINWSKNPTNPEDPHRKIAQDLLSRIPAQRKEKMLKELSIDDTGTFSKLMTNGIITKKDVGFGNLEPTAKSHHGLKEIAEATQQRKAAAHSDSGHSETPTKK
jgi:hypothetical protein